MTTHDKKRDLPARPSLDHLKSQAKDLLDAVRSGDAQALARIRANLPDAAASMPDPSVIVSSLKLHDAQSVIAREYGVASWAELRDRVESMLNASALQGMNLPARVLEAMSVASREPQLDVPSELPPELPLIPVRNALLTAGIVAPLHIGRATTIEAIRSAERNGSGLLATFAQRDEAIDAAPASADELHPTGTLVRLICAFDDEAGGGRGLWIVVRALRWILLEEVLPSRSLVRVTPFEVDTTSANNEDVARLATDLRARVKVLAASLPHPEAIIAMTETMTPLELADVTIANVPCSVEDKARYASERSLSARLTYVLGLVSSPPPPSPR